MKKINNSILKRCNVIIAVLLGLLGFTNCETREEYGSPQTDYIIKGKVVDKATGNPIPGIKVRAYGDSRSIVMYGVPPTDYRYIYFTKDADTSNARGDYQLDGNSTYSIESLKDVPLSVQISDIDGAENGVYTTDTTIVVDFKDAVRTKKEKSWFDGEYTKTVNIELPEKK
jgi:putative lipoprotein (rSAM/lipoprotein system)